MRNRASWRCMARGRAAMARATIAAISSHCAASSREASGTTQVATARNTGEESVIAGNVDVAPQAGNKSPRPLLDRAGPLERSEEHTSELQSHGLSSYAVFCLKK